MKGKLIIFIAFLSMAFCCGEISAQSAESTRKGTQQHHRRSTNSTTTGDTVPPI